MPLFHAVVWMDHQQAHVLQFDAESIEAQRVKARSHHPRHHGTDERALHQYYEQVAQAVAGTQEVLLTGPGQAHDDFKLWCVKHDAVVAKTLVGSERTDHPSDNQLVALARQYFLKFDRMAGTPTPT
jgi:stalled ribosome rescue protein Dom34